MWDPAKKAADELVFRQAMIDLLTKTRPDVAAFPELNNNETKLFNGQMVVWGDIVSNIKKCMGDDATKNAGKGDIFSVLPFDNVDGSTIQISLTNGFPVSYFSSVHYCYYDGQRRPVAAQMAHGKPRQKLDAPINLAISPRL